MRRLATLRLAIIATAAAALEARYLAAEALESGRNHASKIGSDLEKNYSKEAAERDYDNYWNLTHFRKQQLRRQQRNQLLAYAFLRGVPYAKVEDKDKVHNHLTKDDWNDIKDIAEQNSFHCYGSQGGISYSFSERAFEDWQATAKA